MNRCMYQVLVIQLHYPLIARNRNQSATPGRFGESFTICATAAKQIILVLSAYNRTFSIRKAPYLIAYATYVSATVHVRVAAQRAPDAETLACLRTCLGWLSQNQQTNPGVANAKASLTNLMRRMGVECQDEEGAQLHQEELVVEHSRSQQPVSSSQSSSQMASSSPGTPFSSIRDPTSHQETMSNSYAPFDMDMVLQRLASGQSFNSSPLSTTLSSTASLAQYDPTGPFGGFGLPAVDSFEGTLPDPIGMSYEPTSVSGGESIEPFVGLTADGNDIPYPMTWNSDIRPR